MKGHIFLLFFSIFILSSCEKVIPIKLDEGTAQLSVDAFIDNSSTVQKIRLTTTRGYFDNVSNPPIVGAIVKITDDSGRVFIFSEKTIPGDYIWTPSITDTLVRIFNTYTLSIITAGEEYQATSIAYPVPTIDSVRYKTQKITAGENKGKDQFIGSFYANDIAGMPNFYWVKSYQNGIFFSKPQHMNLSQDGAFAGGGTDGLMFIVPIREGIIPFDAKISSNDSITVNLYALNPQTYFYLNEVLSQTTNSGLFATPPNNVSTNIENVNPNSKTKAVGWFNIGEMTTGGMRIK